MSNRRPDSSRPINRRDFLRMSGGCAALTSATLLSSVLNLSLVRSALAQVGDLAGYKALVCLFLHGGADTFNVLTPYEPGEYADYEGVRGGLALAHGDLLPVRDSQGRRFGIHPGMTEVRDLYEDGNLAFLANVGSLVAPTDRNSYDAKLNLPRGLFSHADQQRHWQTSVPQSRHQITGWAGRMADALTDSSNSNPAISMNVALNHFNILQSGDYVIPYVISSDSGAATLAGYGASSAMDRILTRTTDSLLEETYSDLLEKSYAGVQRNAIDAAAWFNESTSAVELSTVFPGTDVGSQLEMVARTIGARSDLEHTRQVFFVERGGWDHHDELLSQQATMLPEVSAALGAFYDATVELGVADDVVLFTISDFSRTLTSNGKGSDHAWGANHWMMGRGVRGGDVYGEYPTSLALGNPLDVGRGRLVPTTSTDAYHAELAQWFGIPNDATMEVVLPNIRNFHPSGSATPPIGYLL